MSYRYGMILRPFGVTMPRNGILVERGTAGSYPLRGDLPPGPHRHGTVEYAEPLPMETVEGQDLVVDAPSLAAGTFASLEMGPPCPACGMTSWRYDAKSYKDDDRQHATDVDATCGGCHHKESFHVHGGIACHVSSVREAHTIKRERLAVDY